MNVGMHHMHRRRRAGHALSAYDYLMYGVGLVQPFALVPQVLAIYVDGNKQGISIVTWTLLAMFNALWAIYGYRHKERPIMTANALLFILDLTIVFGVLYY